MSCQLDQSLLPLLPSPYCLHGAMTPSPPHRPPPSIVLNQLLILVRRRYCRESLSRLKAPLCLPFTNCHQNQYFPAPRMELSPTETPPTPPPKGTPPPAPRLRLFSPSPRLVIRPPVLGHRVRLGRTGCSALGAPSTPPPYRAPPLHLHSHQLSFQIPYPSFLKRPGVCCGDVRDEDLLSSCPRNHTLQPPQRPLPPPYRLPPLHLHSHQLALQRPKTRFLKGAGVCCREMRDQDLDLVRFVEEVGC